MVEESEHIARLRSVLAEHGLHLRGSFAVEAHDALHLPTTEPACLVLVGQIGPSLERLFRSGGLNLKAAQPLDVWTREILDPLAESLGGRAFYPFTGPPFLPFESWALRAGGVFRSPLGLLIHPQYGLWHAYRGALLLPGSWTLPQTQAGHPCLQCSDRPCLSACPVQAFRAEGYDAAGCRQHLSGEPDCMVHGCESRRACPVGARYHYGVFQMRFHMAAFHQPRA